MINYYRDMWWHRSELLAPLTMLTSMKVKWHWTDREQKAFESIKKVVGRNVLLSYPDFNAPFEIYTDASHTQLGTVNSLCPKLEENEKKLNFFVGVCVCCFL